MAGRCLGGGACGARKDTSCALLLAHLLCSTSYLHAAFDPLQLRRKVAVLAEEAGRLREALQDAEGRVSVG